ARQHVAPERRVPRNVVPEHRIHDGQLVRRAVVGALARSGELLHARRGEEGGADQGEPAPPHLASAAFANASGRRSRRIQRRAVLGPTAIASRSNPNSASSCRHAPQGDAGGSTSVARTMRLNPRAPTATAAPMAIPSPQLVSP